MVQSRRDPHSWRALGLVLLASLAASGAGAAEDISVETARRDSAVQVVCRATVQAPLELIWQTLTDYNGFGEFIPGMRSSRLLEQQGPMAIVEQSGEARFLFVSIPIDVTVASIEHPPHALEIYLIKGSLKRLEGRYQIEPQGEGRMRLSWNGIVEPAISLPPLIGELLMRSNIEDQFRGMVREIERRDALRREREKEPVR